MKPPEKDPNEANFTSGERPMRGSWFRRAGKFILDELDRQGERIREEGLGLHDRDRVPYNPQRNPQPKRDELEPHQ